MMGLRQRIVIGAVSVALVLAYRNVVSFGGLEKLAASTKHLVRNQGGDDYSGSGGGGGERGTADPTNGASNPSNASRSGAVAAHLRAPTPTATTVEPHRGASGEEESAEGAAPDDDGVDASCPFRHSKLHRRIYVYPNPGTEEYSGSIVSDEARAAMAAMAEEDASRGSQPGSQNEPLPRGAPLWPWIPFEHEARTRQILHYDLDSEWVQYDTELLVRELLTNPDSCLRTYDPEEALLFYVPYMPSLEERARVEASDAEQDPSRLVQSRYGRAILDAIVDRNYTGWESPDLFGLSSTYWKRKNGTDHVLVYSEPMHGLYHDFREGSFHYVNTQLQLQPPIAVGVELSKTFVSMHPKCARKNILLPYPNPDGRWFNGAYDRQVRDILEERGLVGAGAPQSEQQHEADQHMLATMYFRAGDKGYCAPELRRAIRADYKACSPSYRTWHVNVTKQYWHGMRISTFCPAPIGDSPSAKRMFDILHAGCIPVVISNDFVWPFTTDIDGAGAHISPDEFSLSFDTAEFHTSVYNHSTCQLLNGTRSWLEDRLAAIPREHVQKWQSALRNMSDLYSWYRRRPDLPDHPLLEGRMPDGGLAHKLVQMLEERSDGSLWAECREERAQQQQLPPLDEPDDFPC